MTMNYDVWWDWVHNLRVSTEDLMRSFFFAKADFEVAQKYIKWYGNKRWVLKKYERARKKMLELVDLAIGLSKSIDRAIEEGKAIPESQRRENYDHLMWRLSQARESVAKVIEYARQNGLIEDLKDGVKTR